MNAYTMFLYFIVLVKVLYSLSVLLQFTELIGWTTISNDFCKTNKERFENLYILLMSILIIYTFRNRAKGSYKFSRFEAELFFVFGIILISQLITNWFNIFEEHEQDIVVTTSKFIFPDFGS